MTPVQAGISDRNTTPNLLPCFVIQIHLCLNDAPCRGVWQLYAGGAELIGANQTKWTLYLHLALEVSFLFGQRFIVYKGILLPELICAELTTQAFKSRIPALTAIQAPAVSVCAADI